MHPEKAEELFGRAETDAEERMAHLKRLVQLYSQEAEDRSYNCETGELMELMLSGGKEMLNQDKLKKVVDSYKAVFRSRWSDENFKWSAIKWFQEHWDINAVDFAKMFAAATETKKTYGLLNSMNNFPQKMMIEFAKADTEAARAMFLNLYDESKSIAERVEKFQTDAEQLRMKYDPGTWQQHYQKPMAITVYLWLRYPEKYYIYKYSVCKATALELESDFVPVKGRTVENLAGNELLFNEIKEYISREDELKAMYREVLTEEFYQDSTMRNIAFDIGFYIANTYAVKEKESDWYPAEYNPGITAEQWKELMEDDTVFPINSLQIIKRMKDYGEMAACRQLSTKYGETNNFYNAGSAALARRVQKKTGCNLFVDETGKERYWPILYLGRNTDKKDDGSYTWKLRDELSEAIEQTDLSEVELYADTEETDVNYWWLNAEPGIWSFSEIKAGEVQSCTMYNDKGNKRRILQNFPDVKAGDIVVGYEPDPINQVVAICKIIQENDGENLYLEKTQELGCPIGYQTLKESPELEKMEYFTNPQGSLFRLTKDEFEYIMDTIREKNPVMPQTQYEKYNKEDFLSEVFMTSEQYDMLHTLLVNKQNLILQGAPGVGKTFAARRLAYSFIGRRDESRVQMVQFHQNYSYEDFVMGYRPMGDGFGLQYGIFYRFCQKAASNPNEPYFFIIDEINRGNMSKIFGELLMLIEKDYRGTKMTLAYNGMPFLVPGNLYIIGMMNTADRSLAMLDYALRRRFSFFDMEPGFLSEGFVKYMDSFEDDTFSMLIEQMKNLNKEIANDAALGKGFCIGHSYFCGKKAVTDEWMEAVVEYDILPMLREYWFDEPAKVQKWTNLLRGVFND